MSNNNFIEKLKKMVPDKPKVLSQSRSSVELYFSQCAEWFRALDGVFLYRLQIKTKVLGWVNVYCGGKGTKTIEQLDPGVSHTFRLRIMFNVAKLDKVNLTKEPFLSSLVEDEFSKNNENLGTTDDMISGNIDKSINAFQNKLNSDLNYVTDTLTDDHIEETNKKMNNIDNDFKNKYAVAKSKALNNVNNNDVIRNSELLNNAGINIWIESQWSEELQARTEPEGPSVVCFCMAVRCGYIKQVNAMMLERPELLHIRNTTDGFTPLATAVRKGNVNMVKSLLNAGADINQRSSTSQTALHLSVYSANISLSEILLERGADIKCRDRNGLSVLHYAVDSGDLQTLIYALGKVDASGRDNKGWTALHRAVIQGADAAIVQLLVDRGCDPEAKDHRGLDCVQLAGLLKQRQDIQRIVNKDFVHDMAVTNFTKLTKKLTTIHSITHK